MTADAGAGAASSSATTSGAAQGSDRRRRRVIRSAVLLSFRTRRMADPGNGADNPDPAPGAIPNASGAAKIRRPLLEECAHTFGVVGALEAGGDQTSHGCKIARLGGPQRLANGPFGGAQRERCVSGDRADVPRREGPQVAGRHDL